VSADFDIDREALLQTFLAESDEGFEAMEKGLLLLETAPDDAEALGSVFRVAHTLKGNAGGLGFSALAGFAHTLEDLLDGLRERRLLVSRDLVTWLLQALDALREILPAAISGATELEAEHETLKQRLAELGSGRRPVPAPASAPRLDRRHVHTGRRREDRLGEAASTLRVDTATLDRMLDLTGEIAVAQGRLLQAIEERPEAETARIREANRELELRQLDFQHLVLRARLVPVGPIFQQCVRTVRDLSVAQAKQALLTTEGEDIEVDVTVVERLRDPLTHMIRNAIGHGIEAPETRRAKGKDPVGRLQLRAYHDAGSIVVQLSDDGAGLNRRRIVEQARKQGLLMAGEEPSEADVHRLILEPGFSTAEAVTQLSGRGVGMDVVRRNIEALRGSVGIESREGSGTTVTIRLPLTLAIIDGFAVGAAGETYVLPMDAVVECLELAGAGGRSQEEESGVMDLRGHPLPFVRLRGLFGLGGEPPARESVVVVRHRDGLVGLAVDTLYGESQTVIKPLGALFRRLPSIAGSAIRGNGRVALILNVPGLVREALQEQVEAVTW